MKIESCRRYFVLLLILGIIGSASAAGQDQLIEAGRQARNRGNITALRHAIQVARRELSHNENFAAYARLALMEDYMCEAGADHHQNNVVKQAAQTGLAAARQAVRLNPKSSEGHRLLGSLLGQMVPYVVAGGVRYGSQSTSETEKAIELDSQNANAYVVRALGYWFTPAMFGGNKAEALNTLKKAISIDPSSDAAATAYVWLAVFNVDQKRFAEARAGVAEALRLEPDRLYAQIVSKRIAAASAK